MRHYNFIFVIQIYAPRYTRIIRINKAHAYNTVQSMYSRAPVQYGRGQASPCCRGRPGNEAIQYSTMLSFTGPCSIREGSSLTLLPGAILGDGVVLLICPGVLCPTGVLRPEDILPPEGVLRPVGVFLPGEGLLGGASSASSPELFSSSCMYPLIILKCEEGTNVHSQRATQTCILLGEFVLGGHYMCTCTCTYMYMYM